MIMKHEGDIMLIETLKAANMEALKNRDKEKRAVLSVLINKYNLLSIELQAKGKQITDADLLILIQKSLKELEDEKAGYESVHNEEKVTAILYQMDILKGYLPKMLSEEEIRAEIQSLEDTSIPSIMKHFKEKYPGQVDMGLVNKIARSL